MKWGMLVISLEVWIYNQRFVRNYKFPQLLTHYLIQ